MIRIPKRDPKNCDTTTKIAGTKDYFMFLKWNNNSHNVKAGLKWARLRSWLTIVKDPSMNAKLPKLRFAAADRIAVPKNSYKYKNGFFCIF